LIALGVLADQVGLSSKESALFQRIGANTPWVPSDLSLAKGAVLLVLGGIVAQGLAALSGLLIARSLGPAGYGAYFAGFALVHAFAYTFSFGLDSIVVREIAAHPGHVGIIIPSAGIPLLIWSALLVLLIGALGGWYTGSPQMAMLLWVAAPAMASRGLVNQVRAALRGFERMDLDALIQSTEGSASLVFVCIALLIRRSAVYAASGILLGELLALSIALFLLHRRCGPFHNFQPLVFRRMIRGALPLGLTFTLIGINLRLDMLVLSARFPEPEVGLYAAALGIAMLSRSLSLVSAALLPPLSAAHQRGPQAFNALFFRGMIYVAVIGLVVGLGASLFAPALVMLLYGPDYQGAVPSLRILGLMSVLLFLNTYLWQALIAINRQRQFLIAVLGSLAATMSLSCVLIPAYGNMGAALTALGREVVQLLALFFFAARNHNRSRFL
jgi:O-antigen/teichoic acid export membrane protein